MNRQFCVLEKGECKCHGTQRKFWLPAFLHFPHIYFFKDDLHFFARYFYREIELIVDPACIEGGIVIAVALGVCACVCICPDQ